MIYSNRLCLRKMNQEDFDAVALMLRDPRVMYAWEKTFTDAEIRAWIQRRMEGYEKNGCDYFLALDKSTGQAVGQIGLLREEIAGQQEYGLGWILNYRAQGRGYAREGAQALADYAFSVLGVTRLVADIRPQNTASVKVAKALGMKEEGSYVKLVDGKPMPHAIYVLSP